MSGKLNIAGQRFGRLVAQQDAGKGKWGQRLWHCICDCGKEIVATGSNLKSGHTQSCGCLATVNALTKIREEKLSNKLDLTGQRFGKLTALEDIDATDKGYRLWQCICDCGNEAIVQAYYLRSGQTQSCGCLFKETLIKRSTSHGHSKRGQRSPEYRSWSHAKSRCFNPNASGYHRYGGRGITMCDRWKHSFEAFLADVGPKPGPEYSLDRIDPNGNYEPGNVRWATVEDQCNNRRSNRKLTVKGVTKTLAEWCKDYHRNPHRVRYRIEQGYTDYEAIFLGWSPSQRRRDTLLARAEREAA